MSAQTNIEWTDRTWNPVRGCTRVSPGCVNCYAERQAVRQQGPGRAYEGLVRSTPAGPRWTGEVRLVPDLLLEPLSWRKPCRVFVNSMSDLFHEALPDEAIDRVFAVMAAARQHTFQVLTKRPERMRAYLSAEQDHPTTRWRVREHVGRLPERRIPRMLRSDAGAALDQWPLPNVCLGVSVEDQARADERIPLLLQTPAAVRFLSVEPLLEPVDLSSFLHPCYRALFGDIHWVIVGGESGPGARPCDVAWIRSVVQQCREAGTACFVKQLGANPLGEFRVFGRPESYGHNLDPKGGDPSQWAEDLRVREFPEVRG